MCSIAAFVFYMTYASEMIPYMVMKVSSSIQFQMPSHLISCLGHSGCLFQFCRVMSAHILPKHDVVEIPFQHVVNTIPNQIM